MLQEASTNTFSAIYSRLTESQRSDLRIRLVVAIGIKDNTLWGWGTGRTCPINQKHREACAEAINAVCETEYTVEELFPPKSR